MKRVALWVATVLGAGYSPFAPGTAGSAAGLLIYAATRHWTPSAQIVLLVGITVVGTWAAGVAAVHFDREDPGQVVVDEVSGQLLTLLLTGVGLAGALLGFVIFRALDIVKPWPANRLESLPGGVGIMADDVMAGVYGWVILRVIVALLPRWF